MPQMEAKRGGLADWKEGRVVLDQCNVDSGGRSHCIDFSRPPRGRFGVAFMKRIAAALEAAHAAGAMASVDQTI